MIKGRYWARQRYCTDNFAWPPGRAAAKDAGNNTAAEQAGAPDAAATVP